MFMYCVSILRSVCYVFFPLMLFFAFLGTECLLLLFFHFVVFSAFSVITSFCMYVLLHDVLVLIPHFLFCSLVIA